MRFFRLAAALLLAAILFTGSSPGSLGANPIHHITLTPGTPPESAALLRNGGSTLMGSTRWADLGTFWTYRLVAPAGSRITARFTIEGDAAVAASGFDQKPLPTRTERIDGQLVVYSTVPVKSPLGDGVRLKVMPRTGPVGVSRVRVSIELPDSNGDGLGNAWETFMGIKPGLRATAIQRPPRPYTSFQTGQPYSSDIAVPTDAVLVYSANEETIRSWLDKGYTVQTMGGFRSGPDYVKDHQDEVQRDAAGNPIRIGSDSFYMIPTPARNENAKQYYASALGNGSTAVCPEEPEIFARAGYSEAFKREWKSFFGTDWAPPHSNIDARYQAEQLKAFLTRRQIETILSDAEKRMPAATRMVAIHSPVTYYQWGISVPHYALLGIPALQEIIGQVWTGTARSPARMAGVRAERTFEVGYLEYSSLNQLVRGTDKRMWFLMDPVEDNPDRTQEDYQRNYEQTLVASLLFPQVNSYEVMPWPQRIYGRVPAGYATIVNNVVGALCEMWRFPDTVQEAGTAGIGSFVSDSMAWQRGEPHPSDYDGFYGLTLPLVSHGIPLDVLQLDRVIEPGYLNRVSTLLLSYDFLKPASPEINRALSDWVKRGGCLFIAGGTDPYDNLAMSWWKKAGFSSPVEALLSEMGVRTTRLPRPTIPVAEGPLTVVLTADGTARNLENRRLYTIDLTPFARQNGSAVVRFEDVKTDDGWGAWLASAELRFGGQLAASFRTGSDLETRFLADETGTGFSGAARFADAGAFWTYRFDNLPKDRSVTLTLDMGNGYLVKAGPGSERPPLLETKEAGFDATVQRLRLPGTYSPSLLMPATPATPLYEMAGAPAPVVWETRVGNGNVIYAGVPPGFFSSTAQSSRWLRALTRRANEKTLGAYREKTSFMIRRGPFKAVRALGEDYQAEGRYVNLLSPTLAVVENPEITARGWAFWLDAPATPSPRLLAVSGRQRYRFETPMSTSFLVQAPSGTEGAARLHAGRRTVAGVRGYTVFGDPVPVRAFPDSDTLLVRYPNHADGVVIRVTWK